MMGWLGNAYLWVKAAHVIFVIFWMAGLFMLPRFFVYHQESERGSLEDRLWIEREARTIRIILNPAMVITWAFGLALMLDLEAWRQLWFFGKFAVVVGLTGYQIWLIGYARKLARGDWSVDGRTLRMINEVPGVAAAVIVVLVIIKPFL